MLRLVPKRGKDAGRWFIFLKWHLNDTAEGLCEDARTLVTELADPELEDQAVSHDFDWLLNIIGSVEREDIRAKAIGVIGAVCVQRETLLSSAQMELLFQLILAYGGDESCEVFHYVLKYHAKHRRERWLPSTRTVLARG